MGWTQSAVFIPLTLTLGNGSRHCPTSCIHAVVSRRKKGSKRESIGSDGVNFPCRRYQRQTRDDAVGVEAVRAGIR